LGTASNANGNLFLERAAFGASYSSANSFQQPALSPAILGTNPVSVNGPELVWATNPMTVPQGLMVGSDFKTPIGFLNAAALHFD
jgi:hypothetical protein